MARVAVPSAAILQGRDSPAQHVQANHLSAGRPAFEVFATLPLEDEALTLPASVSLEGEGGAAEGRSPVIEGLFVEPPAIGLVLAPEPAGPMPCADVGPVKNSKSKAPSGNVCRIAVSPIQFVISVQCSTLAVVPSATTAVFASFQAASVPMISSFRQGAFFAIRAILATARRRR